MRQRRNGQALRRMRRGAARVAAANANTAEAPRAASTSPRKGESPWSLEVVFYNTVYLLVLPVLHSICGRFKLYKEIFECYTESCEVYPVGDEEVSSTPERWTSTGVGHVERGLL